VSEHTPGPWRISKSDWTTAPWRDAVIIEGDIEGGWAVPPEICALYRGAEQEADARLIAAAPDLFAALKAFAEVWGACGIPPVEGERRLQLALTLIGGRDFDAACAAIKKATQP
jgi:hypothetical protein